LLRNCTHRTNHGEFLWRSDFNQLAGRIVLNADISDKFDITVLFDAFYLCPAAVHNACKECKWTYISVSKSNRWFTVNSVKHKSRYLKRWAIEVMIKEQKQHLGLGDYRVWRYRAIVRHLCLVDSAYACLTHVGIDDQHAQGDTNDTKEMLSLGPISQLKARMHQIVWRQEVQNVIKVSHDKNVIRRLEKLLAA
ncbi:MAG TPA: hypothetical protein P5182_12190, partial [Myxococcota bacterium]|nr:hypothetical protein [Myxococcota bacterium]